MSTAPPTIATNTTPETARDLGTVVHYLGTAQAILPGFEDAYFALTVPTEAAVGAGKQVLDFSALFQYAQGTGLQMEVLDENGKVLGSGERFRVQTASFNDAEAGLLASRPDFTGHPVVAGPNREGAVVAAPDLVQSAGPLSNFESFKTGTVWLSELHDELGARLDANLGKLGDDPTITADLLNLVIDKVVPGLAGPGASFLILVFDPVSIDLADPQGERAQVDLKTNEVKNTQARTFIEAGGNVEVMVLAGVSGTYTVNLSDVQASARAGSPAEDPAAQGLPEAGPTSAVEPEEVALLLLSGLLVGGLERSRPKSGLAESEHGERRRARPRPPVTQ